MQTTDQPFGSSNQQRMMPSLCGTSEEDLCRSGRSMDLIKLPEDPGSLLTTSRSLSPGGWGEDWFGCHLEWFLWPPHLLFIHTFHSGTLIIALLGLNPQDRRVGSGRNEILT